MIGGDPDWTSKETQMTLTVHNLAKTYMMLPSEVLSRATTFDLYVFDTFHRYQRALEKKNKYNKDAPLAKTLTQDEMKAMIEKVKKRDMERRNAKISTGSK